jgi:phosphoserine phosphatase RsbU/P
MTDDTMVMDVSQDWMTASHIQHRFMRGFDRVRGTLDCRARCRQVRVLGGDCYDFLPLAEHRLAFVIGDASGKGLPAALMMANVQSSLRTAALFTGSDAGAALKAVNRQVHGASLGEWYATLFYGVFDGATCTLQYVNAGHNPPMVIRGGSSIHWLEAGGAPLGMFPDWTYVAETIQLNPGDLVVAYTDGVIEAVNAVGEEWGVEGLRTAVVESEARCADEIVHVIFGSMDAFSRGCQADDVTVAVLRVY